ncbi:hypothetical protein BV22DRAFT_785356 [Leucogyrophana mollusca]|uniref:Uncharacterized protein n=1 Tax=Leucogyrophana mollusca TaxID=85980 RepID=A0ACB8B540_9AGAM|nr:hypothetical protein BV22DRAFT_785356 [Leucogyrophana mollusca]
MLHYWTMTVTLSTHRCIVLLLLGHPLLVRPNPPPLMKVPTNSPGGGPDNSNTSSSPSAKIS